MTRTAIISVDGHVKASRAGYREYLEEQHLETFDEMVKAEVDAGIPDAGNLNPQFGVEAQWDSDRRLEALESKGVVAEVLFPNGVPFQTNRLDDIARVSGAELAGAGRRAYNRWLADFSAEAPGRRAGQALVSFQDVDGAVEDIHWAKEHGLMGVSMPPLMPGGRMFFDPALDPVWATCQELGMVVSQHGGAGIEPYSPPGFAAIVTLAIESAFFSNRSLWQMIAGGVFERFPDLKMAFVETQVMFMVPAMERLDKTLSSSDDWMAFARSMGRERTVTQLASEYFEQNCYVGVSPFTTRQIGIDDLVGLDDDGESLPGWHISADRAMFGVDYPHFESIFTTVEDEVASLVEHPAVTEADAQNILFDTAADLYGFDRAVLQPHVDRVGFEIGTHAAV